MRASAGLRARRLATGLLVLALAACALPGERPPAPIVPSTSSAPAPGSSPAASGSPTPGAAAQGGAGAAAAPSGPLAAARPSGGRSRPAPIADRRIDLDGRCTQAEEDGFREEASLLVRDNEVRSLAWQLWVGRKGSCRFDHADFRQTRSAPHIELLARDGSGCKLMVWQDPRRVTLAHAGCQKRCSGGIYDQAWPVMFDPKSGACARTDR